MILAGIAEDRLVTAPGGRREAFVKAARVAFFARGYAGTTMSSIAAAVGGSKTTLWAYFPAKEDLFAAVVDDIVERYGRALSVDMAPEWPLDVALRRFARAMMDTILSEPIVALHRLVAGEAGRFPELAALFYERGPKRGNAKLSDYLTAAMAAGAIRPGDPHVVTRQFSAMCQSGCYQHVLLGLRDRPAEAEINADIEAALTTFLRAWAV